MKKEFNETAQEPHSQCAVILTAFNQKVQTYQKNKFQKQKKASICFDTISFEQRASEFRAHNMKDLNDLTFSLLTVLLLFLTLTIHTAFQLQKSLIIL